MKHYNIAMDGPAGAGKSSLAKALAAKLGALYVDTGAIYRTVGLYVARQGGDCGKAEEVLPKLPDIHITLDHGPDGLQRMYLNGEDVTTAIRENAVSRYASQVSAIPEVRAFLLDMQRKLAAEHNVVMDGRDIGTVILPDAEVKIFLTASAQVRAERRCRELVERGTPQPFEEVLQDIEDRDFRDTHREAAPLRQAEGAALLDTSALDFQQSLEALLGMIRERTGL